MAEKVLPAIDFDESVESKELDLKVFVGTNGSSAVFAYNKPSGIPTMGQCIDAARTAIETAGGKEFGALAEAFKFDRKKGSNATNYKTPKATEADLKLRNCTIKNYKAADEMDGQRFDWYVLDESNATLTIHSGLKTETSESADNTKDAEIGFKLTSNTASTNSRIVINLLTGETTKPVIP